MICPKCSNKMEINFEGVTAKWCTEHQTFHAEKQKPSVGEFAICTHCLEVLCFTGDCSTVRTLTDEELFEVHSRYGKSIGLARRLIAEKKAEKDEKKRGRTRRPDGLD